MRPYTDEHGWGDCATCGARLDDDTADCNRCASALNDITRHLGHHCGLNAEWCIRAWHLHDDLYICDEEDGMVTLSLQLKNADGEVEDTEVIATRPAVAWRDLLAIAREYR